MLSNCLYAIRSMRALYALFMDPRRTDMVFSIMSIQRQLANPLFIATVDRVKSFPGFNELVEQDYNPELPAHAELLKFPVGSLGYEFAHHVQENQLTINFYHTVQGQHVAAYIINRARKCHDFWHVLTGFDISVPGELGVQGFTLAQIRSPLSATLIAGGLMHCTFRNRAIFHQAVEQVFYGYQMGLHTRPLLATRLEDMLAKNVDQLRDELGIKPWKN